MSHEEMKMTVRETAHEMKLASPHMAACPGEKKNGALAAVKEAVALASDPKAKTYVSADEMMRDIEK